MCLFLTVISALRISLYDDDDDDDDDDDGVEIESMLNRSCNHCVNGSSTCRPSSSSSSSSRPLLVDLWMSAARFSDVIVSDYRSVGVAGSLAGGRVTSGSRQRDTSARDTRGSTHSSGASRPPLLANLLCTAAAAVLAASSTVATPRLAGIRSRRRLL